MSRPHIEPDNPAPAQRASEGERSSNRLHERMKRADLIEVLQGLSFDGKGKSAAVTLDRNVRDYLVMALQRRR